MGRSAELIEWANRQAAPVLALDTPGGLDVTTGRVGTPASAPQRRSALPCPGLMVAPVYVGRLLVVDISVQRVVYERMGLHAGDPFSSEPIVEIAI